MADGPEAIEPGSSRRDRRASASSSRRWNYNSAGAGLVHAFDSRRAVCGAKRIAQHANPGLLSSPVRLSAFSQKLIIANHKSMAVVVRPAPVDSDAAAPYVDTAATLPPASGRHPGETVRLLFVVPVRAPLVEMQGPNDRTVYGHSHG